MSSLCLETPYRTLPLGDFLYLIDENISKSPNCLIEICICTDMIPAHIFFVYIADFCITHSSIRLDIAHEITHDRALSNTTLSDEYFYDIFPDKWDDFFYVFLSAYYVSHI